MRTLFVLSLIIFLVACATNNDYVKVLDTWRGKQLENLLQSWGAPDQVISIPGGNTYYVYSAQSIQSAPGPYIPTFATFSNNENKAVMGTIMMPSPPSLYVLTCRTWFEVNKNNKIVNVGAKGNYCYANM